MSTIDYMNIEELYTSPEGVYSITAHSGWNICFAFTSKKTKKSITRPAGGLTTKVKTILQQTRFPGNISRSVHESVLNTQMPLSKFVIISDNAKARVIPEPMVSLSLPSYRFFPLYLNSSTYAYSLIQEILNNDLLKSIINNIMKDTPYNIELFLCSSIKLKRGTPNNPILRSYGYTPNVEMSTFMYPIVSNIFKQQINVLVRKLIL